MIEKEKQSKMLTKRIIQLINENNITINKLATLASLRQSTLNGIINEGRIPSIPTIYAICEALNISLQEFFDFYPYNKKEAL